MGFTEAAHDDGKISGRGSPLKRGFASGIMTAVGVVSIVIACFSALSNLGSIASAALFMTMSRMAFPMPVATTGPTTVPTTGPATTASVAVVPTTMMSPFQMPPHLLILTAVGGLLGLLTAILLFIAGIQVLRNRRGGRTLHWIFIAVKVPVVLIVGVITYLFTESMMRGVAATVPQTPLPMSMTSWMILLQTIVYGVISLAYPLGLVFVLRSRTAREYFAQLTA